MLKRFWTYFLSRFETRRALKIASILFFAVYLTVFFLLEGREGLTYHIIYTPLDDAIPFLPGFVFFYYSWFIYCYVILIIFFFTSEKDYFNAFWFMAFGMTLFCIVSYFYPTALELRPDTVEGTGIAAMLVRAMYAIDTPTNVFPSIHVYDTVGMHAAILHSDTVAAWAAKHSKDEASCRRKITIVRLFSAVWGILICLSTLFIKQHSILDLISGLVLGAVVYFVMYMRPKKGDSPRPA